MLAAKHYALGEISKEKYKKMTADYEAEQERLKLEIETTEEWVEQRQAMGDDLDAFIALTKKYVDVTELTQTIVNEYIKKIIIHAPDKSGGKRRQKVEIFFRCAGNSSAKESIYSFKNRKSILSSVWESRSTPVFFKYSL